MNTHGITPEFKKRISERLKNSMFSLNIDEATKQNMDKIIIVLVCFFDKEENGVKTQQLASRKMNIANASALWLELKDVIWSGVATSHHYSTGQLCGHEGKEDWT